MRNFIASFAFAALSITTAACATGGDDTEYGDVEGEATSAGKVDVWQAGDGQWHFHLKSGNGAVLLTSEAYTSRTGAINGVLSTVENGVDPLQYEVAPAAHGYVLHLKAGNGATIGFSEVYSTKSSATRAVNSCVKATTTYQDKREANTTGARVEVAQGSTGQFHFNMFAKNGQIVVSSESYTTEAAAYNGAFAVQTAGQSATAYALKSSANDKWFWTISAENGQIVGVSQMYSTKASAQSAITATTKTLAAIPVL